MDSTGQFVDQLLLNVALVAVEAARAAVLGLLSSFGQSTEPDFTSIGPIYGRTLAIALLLVGAFVASYRVFGQMAVVVA